MRQTTGRPGSWTDGSPPHRTLLQLNVLPTLTRTLPQPDPDIFTFLQSYDWLTWAYYYGYHVNTFILLHDERLMAALSPLHLLLLRLYQASVERSQNCVVLIFITASLKRFMLSERRPTFRSLGESRSHYHYYHLAAEVFYLLH